MESKHDKFVRLAEKRTNNAIKQLELIGNLANKRNYDYSEEEVNEIFKALNNAMKASKQKFEAEINTSNISGSKFTLR